MAIQAPANIAEQTRRLIETGVANVLLCSLPARREETRGLSPYECHFWARRTPAQGMVPSQLQVVIHYPGPDDEHHRLSGCCAMTVLNSKGPRPIANGKPLDTEQLAVVEELAA